MRGKLAVLAETRPSLRVLLVDQKGTILFRTLSLLSDEKSPLEETTVILPPGVGKLVRGMFKEEFEAEDGVDESDVADKELTGRPAREHWVGSERNIADDEEERRLPLFDSESSESDECVQERYVIYRKQKPPRSAEKARKPYRLETHHDEVEAKAGEFAKDLVPELQDSFRRAGKLHDRGKARRSGKWPWEATRRIRWRSRLAGLNRRLWPGIGTSWGLLRKTRTKKILCFI